MTGAAHMFVQPGASIGRYKLLERIGEGGMGTIWMAEQREPVKKRVALEIIRTAHAATRRPAVSRPTSGGISPTSRSPRARRAPPTSCAGSTSAIALEVLAALEARLPALLEGQVQPSDNAERLEYARMCHVKELYRASAGLSAEVFAVDPGIADDLDAGHRRNAAGSAALAAGGSGQDGSNLDDRERARLRRQAGDWLRADLALFERRLETEKPEDCTAVENTLREWQEGSDLAGIRDASALALLPAEDQARLGRLWTDVATLLAKAHSCARR